MATQHIICSDAMIGHTWYNYKPPANVIAGGLTLSLNKVTAIRPDMYIAILSNTVSSFWIKAMILKHQCWKRIFVKLFINIYVLAYDPVRLRSTQTNMSTIQNGLVQKLFISTVTSLFNESLLC